MGRTDRPGVLTSRSAVEGGVESVKDRARGQAQAEGRRRVMYEWSHVEEEEQQQGRGGGRGHVLAYRPSIEKTETKERPTTNINLFYLLCTNHTYSKK